MFRPGHLLLLFCGSLLSLIGNRQQGDIIRLYGSYNEFSYRFRYSVYNFFGTLSDQLPQFSSKRFSLYCSWQVFIASVIPSV